jgi:hypothetical protein
VGVRRYLYLRVVSIENTYYFRTEAHASPVRALHRLPTECWLLRQKSVVVCVVVVALGLLAVAWPVGLLMLPRAKGTSY